MIGLGSCWIEEEKWSLEVWKSSGIKGAQICVVDTGCGSGVLLTSREGDRVSFVMGTQRSVIDFLNIHFYVVDSHPIRATLWHWMLTEGLT